MCVSVAIRIQISCPIGRLRSLGTLPPVRIYPGAVTAGGRTYQIRTYGCQMNAHDSERLAGLLDEAGYQPAGDGETPDVVVFNTCAVRENAGRDAQPTAQRPPGGPPRQHAPRQGAAAGG